VGNKEMTELWEGIHRIYRGKYIKQEGGSFIYAVVIVDKSHHPVKKP
jgi:hypothetical protein